MMRAIEIDGYGGPDVLKLREVEDPTPGGGQVLVRVEAASYNPVDTELREGAFDPVKAASFPQRQGKDFAGVVEAVGMDTTRFAVGDEVIGCLAATERGSGGTWAERVVTGVEHVGAKPAGLSWEEAAALPLVGMTALQALRGKGEMRPNASVFVNGASGGVGHLAVQVARALGAARVVGSASPEHLGFVRGLGVDEAVDYHDFDPAEHGDAFDVFFDAAAKLSFTAVRACLTDHGHYVSTRPGVRSGAEAAATHALGVVGYDKRAEVMMMAPDADDLALLKRWVEAGKLRVEVAETFGLDKYRRFVEAGEASEAPGKVVLRI